MSDRYIPHGAYEAAAQAWGMLTHADLQLGKGNIDEALEYFRVGLLLLPRMVGEAEEAKAKVVSICVSRAAEMAPTARDDAIALVEGTLAIVGDDPELQSTLAEMRGRGESDGT